LPPAAEPKPNFTKDARKIGLQIIVSRTSLSAIVIIERGI
jgi:hypothetical protein